MFMRVKINQETKRKFPRWMDALGYTPNTCIHSPLPAKWECLRSTGRSHALAKGPRNIYTHTYIYYILLSTFLELEGMLTKGKPFVLTILVLKTLVVYLLHSSCHSPQSDDNLPCGFYKSSNVK